MADDPDDEDIARDVYSSQDEAKTIKAVLGPGSFHRPDTSNARFHNVSEGAAAATALRQGATPADLVKTFQGMRTTDIALPPEHPTIVNTGQIAKNNVRIK